MSTDPTGKLGHDAGIEDEDEFLREYRKQEYPKPSVTVDIVVFTVVDTDLKVLMIERNGHPFKGCHAIPGGFVDVGDVYDDQGESLYDAAARELGEECFGDVDGGDLGKRLLAEHRIHLEQLFTFGDPGRDPRMRVIDVAYYALVPPDIVPLVKAGSDAAKAVWLSVAHDIDWERLAFDHARILHMGVERIRGKLDYSPIAFSLLPAQFTNAELRAVHEAVKGTSYDPGNFRRRFRRMQTDGIIERAPGKRQTPTKPAKVYRFVHGDRASESYRISPFAG